MPKEQKFVVAVKDVSTGKILPGKKLAQYRKQEFAERDHWDLANRAGLEVWRTGIFLGNTLIS